MEKSNKMRLSERQIAVLKNYFADKPVRQVYLFGSYARGDADENSDIDLFVQLDYERLTSAWDVFNYGDEIGKLMRRKVDFATKLSKYIADEVEREKLLIYEKA